MIGDGHLPLVSHGFHLDVPGWMSHDRGVIAHNYYFADDTGVGLQNLVSVLHVREDLEILHTITATFLCCR